MTYNPRMPQSLPLPQSELGNFSKLFFLFQHFGSPVESAGTQFCQHFENWSTPWSIFFRFVVIHHKIDLEIGPISSCFVLNNLGIFWELFGGKTKQIRAYKNNNRVQTTPLCLS